MMLKIKAIKNLKSCESFILFTFTEKSGFQLWHQFNRTNDFNGLIDFMEQFINYHKTKNNENTQEFFNIKYNKSENDKKVDYLG